MWIPLPSDHPHFPPCAKPWIHNITIINPSQPTLHSKLVRIEVKFYQDRVQLVITRLINALLQKFCHNWDVLSFQFLSVLINKYFNSAVSLATLDPDTKFIGFYLQARDENDNAVGQFTPNADTKVHNCLGKRAVCWYVCQLLTLHCVKLNKFILIWLKHVKNAAHHASGLVKKDNITIVWSSPRNFQGEIVFTYELPWFWIIRSHADI